MVICRLFRLFSKPPSTVLGPSIRPSCLTQRVLLRRNCAGFLRVRAGDETGTELDPLDDMRIHPLAYQLAGSVARAALGVSTDAVDEDDQEQNLIERALKEKAKIEGVNLAVSCAAFGALVQHAGEVQCSYRRSVLMSGTMPAQDECIMADVLQNPDQNKDRARRALHSLLTCPPAHHSRHFVTSPYRKHASVETIPLRSGRRCCAAAEREAHGVDGRRRNQ